MRVVLDLDGTLCTGYPYEDATPKEGAVEFLAELQARGHYIIINTARCMGRTNNNAQLAEAMINQFTIDQLAKWGFVYDEIFFGKPGGDLYVDDKGAGTVDFKELLELVQ